MQGFNMGRYHAPSSLDTSLAPPTKRARLTKDTTKASPTIRFEMPFAIWCSTCPPKGTSNIIGQGVRFNALKSKVGMYHSTPIWSFRMKHTACGAWIEIRTDPASSEFVVTEGARRRDTGSDAAVAERVGGVLLGGTEEEAERERRSNDAFAALEGKKEEAVQMKEGAKRVDELRSFNERSWRDPDAANRKARALFRPGRRARERDAEKMVELKERIGWGGEVLEESEGDRRRAGLVEFGVVGAGDEVTMKAITFGERTGKVSTGRDKGGGKLQALHQELADSTRAAMDPFSTTALATADAAKGRLLTGVRRKQCGVANDSNGHGAKLPSNDAEPADVGRAKTMANPLGGLVDYDSE